MPNSIKFMLIFSGVILILFFTDIIGFWGLIGLILLTIIIGTIWSAGEGEEVNEQKKPKDKMNEKLRKLDGFSPTKELISTRGLIAIDDNSQQIALKEFGGKIKKYPYSAILSCEVIEDGETTYRKSSTVGRAIVGGVIAGAPGAIIGGLSGKKKENKKITSLDLKVVMKDTNNPSFNIRFFDALQDANKKSIKVTDSVYGPTIETVTNQLKKWKDRLEVIIAQMDNLQENT